MTDRPLVSFLVPCFNKEKYIAAVIRHIDAQTGAFDREIIIINDGSTDATGERVAEIAQGRHDIRVLTLEDEGPAFALNKSAAIAQGAYLKFIDGDDLLRTDATAILLKALADPGVALAYGDAGEYDSDQLDRITPSPSEIERAPGESPLGALRQTLHHIGIVWSGCMARRADYLAAGGCDERVFVHDVSILPRLALLGRFVDVGGIVVDRPFADAERWSHRASAQVFHDGNYAVAWFLNDHPDLPLALRRFAFRRCAGRAYKWRVRRDGFFNAFTAWLRFVLSRAPWAPRYDLRCWSTCSTFEAGGPMRRPGGALPKTS